MRGAKCQNIADAFQLQQNDAMRITEFQMNFVIWGSGGVKPEKILYKAKCD